MRHRLASERVLQSLLLALGWADPALSADPLACFELFRCDLPPYAELFELYDDRDASPRGLGRGLDGTCATAALSALGDMRPRSRPRDNGWALVEAVGVWPLAVANLYHVFDRRGTTRFTVLDAYKL